MPFPSPPWHLRARAWGSVFVVGSGLQVAAFVDYQAGGVLAYHELLVARLVPAGRRPALRITDIWVDSAASLAGGRSLWAIPKRAGDLVLEVDGRRASVSAAAQGPVASAAFASGPSLPRLPFAAATSQLREDGRHVLTPFSGSGRVAPCRAAWELEPDGPLGHLARRRPVVSFHLRDVRLRFG